MYFLSSVATICDCARTYFESPSWAFQIQHSWLIVTLWKLNEGECHNPINHKKKQLPFGEKLGHDSADS